MASRPGTPPQHYSTDEFAYSPTHSYHEAQSEDGTTHPRSTQGFSLNVHEPGMDGFENSHNDLAGSMATGNGLGSLADELADAWYGDEEEGDELAEGYSFSGYQQPQHEPGEPELEPEPEPEPEPQHGSQRHNIHDDAPHSPVLHEPQPLELGLPMASPTKSSVSGETEGRLSPKKDAHVNRHRRLQSQYDGSDYGNDSDLEESPGITSGLEARMAVIESLARRGTEENGGEGDTVVERVVNGLRDLGGQSGVEGGATRLITAHTALSTHLTHQTRTLHSLAFPLFSPLSIPPDGEAIDELLPILTDTATLVPQPSAAALSSLSQLSYLTTDLVRMLDHLSDSLHMSRQTTTAAARRLRSARELTAEMRRETEAREESERWIERGSWQTRLGERECATVCREVVGGFEEVCQGWRDRLVAAAEVGAG